MKDDIELLSAYLDGELSKSEHSTLEARLEKDAELVEQLNILKANDDTMRGVFNSINSAPLPTAITDLLANESQVTQVYALPKRTSWSKSTNWTAMFGAAACITLAVAFTLGTNHMGSSEGDLQQTLSEVASGEIHGDIHAEFSFLTSDKKLCRQYLNSSAEKHTRSISCHTADGWKQMASVEVNSNTESDLYVPAGADANALDDFINQNIEGAPLTANEEKEALNRIK